MNPSHILITGAAGAIGSALAREMRAAWPGARLALLDRDAASLHPLAASLGNATTHGVDLADIDALPGAFAEISRDLPLDGLVNCAGIMHVRDVSSWEWDVAASLMAIDLLAPLRLQDLLARAIAERARANGPDPAGARAPAPGSRGLIVNIASVAGKVPLKGCAYYGASKAGLAMASEIARADLAPLGIQVLTVYPGPVRSALERGARDAYGGGGLFGRLAPTGDPVELAQRIMAALDRDEPRVIYPRLYGVGWSATNLTSWFALSYGPPPVS